MIYQSKEPITLYLKHYASPYYDPVKAHEYYMEHRKLKGRRSSARLSDEGKEVWAYTKNQIQEEKKQKLESERNAHDQELESLRAQSEAERKRIKDRLKQLNEALERKANAERARLRVVNSYNLKHLTRVGSIRNEQKVNAAKAAKERKKVSVSLKAALDAAREAYKQTKTDIKSSYEDIFQSEYDRILAEYAKPEKEPKQKTSSKKSGSKKDTSAPTASTKPKTSSSTSTTKRSVKSFDREKMKAYLSDSK